MGTSHIDCIINFWTFLLKRRKSLKTLTEEPTGNTSDGVDPIGLGTQSYVEHNFL